ncbi:MAG: hypothetical protein O2840_02980, partial [bacterium]|nr:hypothetical protein [bacterium]
MSALVTQATSDQPEVVFFTDHSPQMKQIVAVLSSQGVTITSFAQEKLRDQAALELCKRAYRVIIWFNPTRSNELERVSAALGALPQLQFLIPVITPCRSPAPELRVWSETSERQSAFLSQLLTLFPQIQCVFLRDVLELGALSPLEQLLQQLPHPQLFIPELTVAPCSLEASLDLLQHLVFHPSRSSSLIQGAELRCDSLLSQAKMLYENIHQQQFSLTSTQVDTTQIIPFHVAIEQTQFSLEAFLNIYSKTLPSPQNWHSLFSLPTLVVPQPDLVVEPAAEEVVPTPPLNIPAPVKKDVGDVIADITSLFANSYREHKTVRTKKVTEVVRVVSKKKKKNTALFLIGLVSTGVTLGIIFLGVVFLSNLKLTQRTLLAALPHLLEDSPKGIEQNPWHERWYSLLTLQTDSYGSLLDIPIISKAEKILSLTTVLREYDVLLPQALQTEQTLIQHLFGQTDSDITLLAQNATTQSQKTYDLLATLETELYTILSESPEDQALQTALSDKLTQMRSTMGLQQQIVPLIPALTG